MKWSLKRIRKEGDIVAGTSICAILVSYVLERLTSSLERQMDWR